MELNVETAEELWKTIDIKGFTHYEISSHGRVRSKARIYRYDDGSEKKFARYIRRLFICGRGFVCVGLFDGDTNRTNTYRVHQLVATHFLTKPSESHRIVFHLDGDRTNNNVSNLLYVRAVRGSRYYI